MHLSFSLQWRPWCASIPHISWPPQLQSKLVARNFGGRKVKAPPPRHQNWREESFHSFCEKKRNCILRTVDPSGRLTVRVHAWGWMKSSSRLGQMISRSQIFFFSFLLLLPKMVSYITALAKGKKSNTTHISSPLLVSYFAAFTGCCRVALFTRPRFQCCENFRLQPQQLAIKLYRHIFSS
jgi:hypothetical protein